MAIHGRGPGGMDEGVSGEASLFRPKAITNSSVTFGPPHRDVQLASHACYLRHPAGAMRQGEVPA
jgi:hypothetical protein